MGMDGPNWNAGAQYGATGEFAKATKARQTGEQVNGMGMIGNEACAGAQQLAKFVPTGPDDIATLERPNTETADVPVPADEDHPVPPGIIAPGGPLV